MTKNIEAIYANGVLKPVQPIDGLEENRRVRLTITADDRPSPFADWVGGISNEDAAQMRSVIEEEFEQVEPDEWK